MPEFDPPDDSAFHIFACDMDKKRAMWADEKKVLEDRIGNKAHNQSLLAVIQPGSDISFRVRFKPLAEGNHASLLVLR